jgi:hypothetical protein
VPKKDFEIVTSPAIEQKPGASLACHAADCASQMAEPPG